MSGYTTISVKKETKQRLTKLMTKEDEYDPFLNKLMDKWEEKHDIS